MKRVTLYTKTGCTTCLKAKAYLTRCGVPYTERDIFKHPLNERELTALIARRSLAEIFSHRSPSVKALGLDDGQASDEQLLAHMLDEPRLIRRPLLTTELELTVGFSETAFAEALALETPVY